MSMQMRTATTTRYTVALPDGRRYETFDYDKAHRMATLTSQGVVAAECVDCKAVIPVDLVDSMREDNRCPATTSVHFPGHRVCRDDYDAAHRSH